MAITLQAKVPELQEHVKIYSPEDGDVGIGCIAHRPYVVKLLDPSLCPKCHGDRAFSEFCPVCRADCECE